MKIIEGYINGFGILTDKKLSFDGGLFAVCSENGSGKSTLIAFIKAMLFGIGETKKTSLFENERRRYAPWNNAKFGGSLTVESSGRRFRIERSFGKRPSEDSFRLFDADSELESREYGENIGEVLLGIDADGAERTLFLTEKNLLPSTESPTISAALSGAVGNVTEADRLGTALEILDKQRKKYVKKGGGGEIDLCRERAVAAKRKLSGRDALLQREREECEAISHITKKLAALEIDSQGIRSHQKKIVRGGNTSLSVSLVISLALCAVSALCGALLSPLFFILTALLGALGITLACIGLKQRARHTSRDYERLDYERSDIDKARLRLTEERAELIHRHESTLEAISEMERTEAELNELLTRLDVIEDELSVIKEAAERLKAANETLAKRHVGGATAAFRGYLNFFSESEGLHLDTELKITKTEGGETHPYESYSRATRDFYAFAARLAAADAIFGGRCPFIILDDPFTAFDDSRLSLALDFLRELSKTRQVIYLTASKSRLPR